jgi:hypothetical protein
MMRLIRFLSACVLCAACLGAQAQNTDAEVRQQVSAFLDGWHDDAAHARWTYFDKIAPDGVYIGTDKSEVWQRDAFKAWARPFFERGKAWSFKAVRRNIHLSPDRQFIWFDELLDTQMGPCQASGVIRKTDTGFLIEHYQLSMAVPNEVGKQVTALIKAHEDKAAGAR